jgi:hypothetical protein
MLHTPTKLNQPVKYFLNNIHIKCIAKSDKKTNDLIYLKLVSKDCGNKNTPTRAFKNGDEKIFTEIDLEDLSKKGGWCVKENDVLKVMAQGIANNDEVLLEIKFTKELLARQRSNCIKIFALSKYEICFELKGIKLA